MQTIQLPIGLLDELDKINRRFFWGDDECHKKTHAVAWNNICRSKEEGGLGLKDLKIMNHVLLAKLT